MSARPPIWVISLPRAVERRRLITSSLDDLPVDYELFDAVDGAELDDVQRRRYSHRRAVFELGRELSVGEVGCALSHLAVYEEMLRRDLPTVVVMEDDVDAGPDFPQVLDALRDLPIEWDLITLHSLFETSDPEPVVNGALVGPHRLCRYRGAIFGTQCYVVTRQAAATLTRVGYPVRVPADELLYRRRPANLIVYGVEPSPVRELSYPSEIVVRPEVVERSSGVRTDGVLRFAGKSWRAP